MKFIITENKLDSIIFNHLDNKNFIIKETPDNYYFLRNEDDIYSTIRVVKINGNCLIILDLVEELEQFFSIDYRYSKTVIKKYVEDSLNITVHFTNPLKKGGIFTVK